MGDEGYLDDEDLINDYIDEVEQESMVVEEFDEALLNSIPVAPQQQSTDATDTTSPSASAEDAMDVDVLPQKSETMDVDEPEEETQAVPVPPTVTVSTLTSRQDDLYAFERFDRSKDWRTTKKSPTTAKGWKRPSADLDSSAKTSLLWQQTKARLLGADVTATLPNSNKTTNAPDAHLIELGSRRRSLGPETFFVSQNSSSHGIHARPLSGQESVPMTLANGTRVHVWLQTHTEKQTKSLHDTRVDETILGLPMAELFRRSDVMFRKALRHKQARKLSALATKDDEQDEKGREKFTSATKRRYDPNYQLWVDKHAPTSFSHLLSDDRTNREVLRALRAWDPYVFRREPPRRPTPTNRSCHESSSISTKPSNSEDASVSSSSTKPANDVRPDESSRVILLSGPAGAGKTTLAHIIARHAGYRPVEVNASDERSASVLRERVLRAMESSTLNLSKGKSVGMAGRPNCLILDEIDGADAKASISALVDIIRAEIPEKKGAKPKTPYLRRPIIFICNQKFAPALRPLLPFAKQFDMEPPSSNRLVSRLRSVLTAENLSVDGGSNLLRQLVAGTGGDIRSCLYTLQFAASRARELDQKKRLKKGLDLSKDASLVDISAALKASLTGDGMKDERNDVSGAVTAVFRKFKEKASREGDGTRRETGIDRVLQLVESFGDNSRTLDCLFMNLPQVSYVDPSLDRCTLAHEWLSGADIYRSNKTSVASNNSMEHYAMQRSHMPAAAAAVHLLCRVETRPDLTFSTRQMSDAHYQHEANVGLTHKFIDGLSAKARGGANSFTVVAERIPYSLWMLSAGEGSGSLSRAVSSLDVLTTNQRSAFDTHVALLQALGLTYVKKQHAVQPHHGDHKHLEMRLEPPIDRLIQFENLNIPPGSRRKTIPSALKELLAHKTTVEGMRQREIEALKEIKDEAIKGANVKKRPEPAPLEVKDSDGHSSVGLSGNDLASSPKRLKESKPEANFLGIGAAKARAARTARKAAQVGFDRSKRTKKSNSGSGVPFDQVVRFKYQKGFTQAVRTPCRMEDIIF